MVSLVSMRFGIRIAEEGLSTKACGEEVEETDVHRDVILAQRLLIDDG